MTAMNQTQPQPTPPVQFPQPYPAEPLPAFPWRSEAFAEDLFDD